MRLKKVVVHKRELVSLGVGHYNNKPTNGRTARPLGESVQKWGKSVSFKRFM